MKLGTKVIRYTTRCGTEPLTWRRNLEDLKRSRASAIKSTEQDFDLGFKKADILKVTIEVIDTIKPNQKNRRK